MVEQAKVLIVEDDPNLIEIISYTIEITGNQVAGVATSLEEAMDFVPQLKAQNIRVVTLDQKLTDDPRNPYDGQIILTAIRQDAPDVKIIGFSGQKFSGVDVFVKKPEIEKLEYALRRLEL